MCPHHGGHLTLGEHRRQQPDRRIIRQPPRNRTLSSLHPKIIAPTGQRDSTNLTTPCLPLLKPLPLLVFLHQLVHFERVSCGQPMDLRAAWALSKALPQVGVELRHEVVRAV